jgi:hypothetical protein
MGSLDLCSANSIADHFHSAALMANWLSWLDAAVRGGKPK